MVNTENKNVDWNAIRSEYISDPESSFRSLAKTYGLSLSTLHKRAKKEDWASERKLYDDKLKTKTLEKLAEERAKGAAKRISTLYDASDRLAKKVLDGIKKTSPTNTLGLRQLTSSLKELFAFEGIVPEAHDLNSGEDESGVVLISSVNEDLKPPEEEETNGNAE